MSKKVDIIAVDCPHCDTTLGLNLEPNAPEDTAFEIECPSCEETFLTNADGETFPFDVESAKMLLEFTGDDLGSDFDTQLAQLGYDSEFMPLVTQFGSIANASLSMYELKANLSNLDDASLVDEIKHINSSNLFKFKVGDVGECLLEFHVMGKLSPVARKILCDMYLSTWSVGLGVNL